MTFSKTGCIFHDETIEHPCISSQLFFSIKGFVYIHEWITPGRDVMATFMVIDRRGLVDLSLNEHSTHLCVLWACSFSILLTPHIVPMWRWDCIPLRGFIDNQSLQCTGLPMAPPVQFYLGTKDGWANWLSSLSFHFWAPQGNLSPKENL